MKTPVTYTASVNDGILSVSFSRKPRLSVRENIRGAGLKYDAASTAWTGKPENPASVLEMLREALGKPSSVTVSVDPEELPEAEPDPEQEPEPEPETPRPPTYEEARAELERFTAAKKSAEDARDEAHRLYHETFSACYMDAEGISRRHEMTDEELAAASEALAPLKDAEMSAYAEIERLEMCVRFAAQNRDRAFFDKYGPAAAEVFNRYSGKPFGPKTSEKITSEIEAKTGISVRFWRHAQYSSDSVTFRVPDSCYSLHGYPRKLFDDDGKILRFDPAEVSTELAPPYVPDVEGRVAELAALRREIDAAKNAIDRLCEQYSSLLPSGDRSDRLYCRLGS